MKNFDSSFFFFFSIKKTTLFLSFVRVFFTLFFYPPKKKKNYSALKEAFSLGHYSDWKHVIEREMGGERVLGDRPFLFQPTSGSSHEKKWIPYTPSLMKEFHEAIGPWLFDLFRITVLYIQK